MWIRVIGTLAIVATIWALVAHHRAVVSERDALADRLDTCQSARGLDRATIETLERTEQENARQYARLLAESREKAGRIDKLEKELRDAAETDIERVLVLGEADDCGQRDMPDGIRVRIDPRTHHDLPDGDGVSGSAGAGGRPADPGLIAPD